MGNINCQDVWGWGAESALFVMGLRWVARGVDGCKLRDIRSFMEAKVLGDAHISGEMMATAVCYGIDGTPGTRPACTIQIAAPEHVQARLQCATCILD
jgi:hypothetical protein